MAALDDVEGVQQAGIGRTCRSVAGAGRPFSGKVGREVGLERRGRGGIRAFGTGEGQPRVGTRRGQVGDAQPGVVQPKAHKERLGDGDEDEIPRSGRSPDLHVVRRGDGPRQSRVVTQGDKVLPSFRIHAG